MLLPASPVFIWGSLLAALALNMLQNMGFWGRAAWLPDLLALSTLLAPRRGVLPDVLVELPDLAGFDALLGVQA